MAHFLGARSLAETGLGRMDTSNEPKGNVRGGAVFQKGDSVGFNCMNPSKYSPC